MLLNPANINYQVGDRIVFLGLVNDYHGDGEVRPLCNGLISREHLRRSGRVRLVEGFVSSVARGPVVSVWYNAWDTEDPRNRDYGRYQADFTLTNRGMQIAVSLLQSYYAVLGQPNRLTREQFEYAEQFAFPVPMVSSNYMRLLTDIGQAAGGNVNVNGLVLKDTAAFRADAERLGISVLTFPYEEMDHRVDGVVRNNIAAQIETYNEWIAARERAPAEAAA